GRNRAVRIVDELRLNRLPPSRVPLSCGRRERPDVELLSARLTSGELGFGCPLTLRLLPRPAVFRSELLLELLRSSLLHDPPGDQRDDHHRGGRNQNPSPCRHVHLLG